MTKHQCGTCGAPLGVNSQTCKCLAVGREPGSTSNEERKRAVDQAFAAALEGDVWQRIGADDRLKRARSKLSLHEIRIIIGHARAADPATLIDGAEMPEVAAMRYIEQLRAGHGSAVTIFCDDEEAESREEALAVEVFGDWTDWQHLRFYGESVLQCLAKAATERDKVSQ